MRIATIEELARRTAAVRSGLLMLACATLVAACGSAARAPASLPRPPAPITLSVLVGDSRVSISPASVGAGPIVFVVTNQSSRAQALAIVDSRGSTLASTAPINPQGTTRLSTDFPPGAYTIATAPQGRTDAQRSLPAVIRPARLRLGAERPNSDGQLLQP